MNAISMKQDPAILEDALTTALGAMPGTTGGAGFSKPATIA
jgi:hypothetical protein